MTAALQFRDLTLGYDRHPAVHHLDGAIASGALMAVVGPNGAGKSTLFKGVVGVIKPLAGGIDLCGLKARDIVGYSMLQFVVHVPLVLLLVWLLNYTLQYVPPVLP